MAKGLVIFDGDDTLWSSESLYDAALTWAERRLDDAGFPGAAWRREQRRIDLINVGVMGMSSERFPQSADLALDWLENETQAAIPSDLRDQIVGRARQVFFEIAEVKPGAREALGALRRWYHLALLTKGDAEVQARRVGQSGLAPLFDTVEIVGDKTVGDFASLADRFVPARALAWSVGNSVASDIAPALEAGLRAVWIDAYVWEHERRIAPDAVDGYLVAPDIATLVSVIHPIATRSAV